MINVYFKKGNRWEIADAGPFFCITAEQLRQARKRYRAELNASPDPMSAAWLLPQQVARSILHDIVPSMNDFDTLVLGYAVTSKNVKIEEMIQ